MIIGFDASRAFVKNKTGTENYSYQLLKHLVRVDQTNNYHIYLRPGELPNACDKWPSNCQLSIVNFPYLWTQLGLALQTFKNPPDILFVPSHTLPLLRHPKLKTVLAVHDLGAEYLPATHQIKQRLYLKFITHYQLKTATHLIAVSKATKKDLINKVGIPAEKISVIYEGYDESLFKPVKGHQLSRILNIYNLQPTTYLLFVGTIQPRKNLERLIRSYSILVKNFLSNHKSPPLLVLAGSRGWLSNPIYSLPKQLGIEKLVKFLGFVPEEHLPALYSGSQALLFPSLFEGFGLPILEAMACGCPVLTSNILSMPEVAGKAAVLVNPDSIESIAQGISRIKRQELRIKLIQLGFSQVKKFGWEKCARETLGVLKKVASNYLTTT